MTHAARRPAAAATALFAVLLAPGCERSAPPKSPGPVAESASATAPAPSAAFRLLRGPGTASYRLTMQGYNQQRELRTEQTAEFTLHTDADGRERVELRSAQRVSPPARDPEAIAVESECRQAFGGDPEVLARFAVTPAALRKPNEVVPDCASRELFSVVTDILMFLSVQTPDFGLDQLRSAGDRRAFGGFESQWSKPPDVLHGRIVCPGGETVLDRVENSRAVVLWQPQPFDHGTIPTPRGAITRLIAGTEKLALTLVIDTRSGALLEARCDADELDLQGWSPFAGETVPDRKDWPQTSGIRMNALRKLTLERLDAPPE